MTPWSALEILHTCGATSFPTLSPSEVGVLAAAGLYALEHTFPRIAEDHANAARLAAGLQKLGASVLPCETNVLWSPRAGVTAAWARRRTRGLRARSRALRRA